MDLVPGNSFCVPAALAGGGRRSSGGSRQAGPGAALAVHLVKRPKGWGNCGVSLLWGSHPDGCDPLLDGNRQCPGHHRLNFLFRHKCPDSVPGQQPLWWCALGACTELLQILPESGARTFPDSDGEGGLLSVVICL